MRKSTSCRSNTPSSQPQCGSLAIDGAKASGQRFGTGVLFVAYPPLPRRAVCICARDVTHAPTTKHSPHACVAPAGSGGSSILFCPDRSDCKKDTVRVVDKAGVCVLMCCVTCVPAAVRCSAERCYAICFLSNGWFFLGSHPTVRSVSLDGWKQPWLDR